MEEYLKKKAAGTAPPATSIPVVLKKGKDISESSDKYTDEEFESMSRSNPSVALLAQQNQKQSQQSSYGQTQIV